MTSTLKLDGVKETLLLPLWGRAFETKKNNPLLNDYTALKIIENIGYDFSLIQEKVNPLSRASWISRAIYFDDKISTFIRNNPDGSVINIGCGLDTTYERINSDKAAWYELDFPEVINIRKQFLDERVNRIFLPFSVFDTKWYDEIKNRTNVLLLFAGVIYYFEEPQVKALFATVPKYFKCIDIIFDYVSPKGVKAANKKLIEESGMDKNAYLKWGINNIYEMEKWDKSIKVIETMKMFHEHKKRYPFYNRLGMTISDALSIMSLAHVKIE